MCVCVSMSACMHVCMCVCDCYLVKQVNCCASGVLTGRGRKQTKVSVPVNT